MTHRSLTPSDIGTGNHYADMKLPEEIWAQIFDQAADEDVIFQYGLPTTMAESAWVKNAFGQWMLRRPSEALNSVQRRSYSTKKVRRGCI